VPAGLGDQVYALALQHTPDRFGKLSDRLGAFDLFGLRVPREGPPPPGFVGIDFLHREPGLGRQLLGGDLELPPSRAALGRIEKLV
jgi:hypothetical protein